MTLNTDIFYAYKVVMALSVDCRGCPHTPLARRRMGEARLPGCLCPAIKKPVILRAFSTAKEFYLTQSTSLRMQEGARKRRTDRQGNKL
jgi:hypothetical protein